MIDYVFSLGKYHLLDAVIAKL